MFHKTAVIVVIGITTMLTFNHISALSSPFQNRLWGISESVPAADVHEDTKEYGEPPEEKTYHIPLILNDSVEGNIEYFLTTGREEFQGWLDVSARYVPMMQEILKEYDLPEELVYVAMIESGFSHVAVSRAKAVGPWQLMPVTGREYGLKIDRWVDERKDPVKSTHAAAMHLKGLFDLFGSWPLALASYNAGASRVQRAALKASSDDFWDLSASQHLRRETRDYVPRFMAAAIIAMNPRAYGFRVPNVPQLRYDEVVIDGNTDLRLIARLSNCTYEEIKELNPEITGRVTPPYDSEYVLRLPSGKKKVFLANVRRYPFEGKSLWEWLKTGPDDALHVFDDGYAVTREKINDIHAFRYIHLASGKRLIISLETSGTQGRAIP